MTFTEQMPNQINPEVPNQLGELMNLAQANLLVLVALGPVKSPGDFESNEDYMAYHEQLRYKCGTATRQESAAGTFMRTSRGALVSARHLQAEGLDDWNLTLYRPGDDFSPEMGGVADHYTVNISQGYEGERQPDRMVTVDLTYGQDPQLKYWAKDGLTPEEIVIEDSELESSYAFRVVTQISEQLQREANALLYLAFDETAA